MAGNNYYANLVQMVGKWTDPTARIHECVCWALGNPSGTYTLAQLNNLSSIMFLNFANAWGPIGAPNTSLTDCQITDWSSATGAQVHYGSSAVAGTGTGELAINTAVLLSLKVPTRYKGGHGRVYLPSIADNVSTDGRTVLSSKLSALQTAVSAWATQLSSISSANAGPFTQVVYHQRIQQKPHTTPPTYIPAHPEAIQSIAAQSIFATQRRRLRKAAHL